MSDDPLVFQLLELTKKIKADRDPTVQGLLQAINTTKNPKLVEKFNKFVQPKITQEIQDPFPFYEPTDEELLLFSKAPKPISLGTLYKSNLSFCLPADLLSRHMLINGRPGTGKTNLLSDIVLKAMQYNPVIIIDNNKIDYRHLIQLNNQLKVYRFTQLFPFNPWQVPTGVDPRQHANDVVEIFCKCFSLLDGSESLLLDTVMQLHEMRGVFAGNKNWPTMSDLKHYISAYKTKDYAEKSLKTRLKGRLNMLISANPENYNYVRGIPIEDLAQESFVLEIRGITERHSRFVVSCILNSLFNFRVLNGERGGILRNLVIVDECKYLVPPGFNDKIGFSSIASILAQSREFGLGFIFADQTARLDNAVFENTFTKVCMGLGSGEDIEKIAKTYPLDQDQRNYISYLATGQGIVKIPEIDPFVLNFPRVRLG